MNRTVDVAGNIVEKTLGNTGKVLSTNNVGKLLDLPVVKETTNAAGQTVRQVRDTGGALIDVTLDNTGKILGSRVVSQGQDQNGGNRRRR